MLYTQSSWHCCSAVRFLCASDGIVCEKAYELSIVPQPFSLQGQFAFDTALAR
jgi:hypothetical protein